MKNIPWKGRGQGNVSNLYIVFVTQSLKLESGSTTSGSVAVYARCGDIFSNRFVANFLENQPVKKF